MRARIQLSSTALLNNFRRIGRKTPSLKLIPMVKANAYGHGAVFAVKTLMKEKQLLGFGVATFEEALEIRKAVPGLRHPLLVFSDTAPWNEERLALCKKHALEPVLSEITSLLQFQKQKNSHTVPAHLEVNTGMNRLGIPLDSLPLLRLNPASIFTHLASAEAPHVSLTRKQMAAYQQVVEWARPRYPHAQFHFANSSAIWNAAYYPLLKEMHWARPGLSLYGIRPFETAKEDGLRRVMTFSAPILNRIFLEKGEAVGYGGSYRCKAPRGEWVVTLGAGYADGIARAFANQGLAVYQKDKTRSIKLQFRGRVSMDLIAVQGRREMEVGEFLVLWGDAIDPYEQANLAKTIPYEITTRVGSRVERIYE